MQLENILCLQLLKPTVTNSLPLCVWQVYILKYEAVHLCVSPLLSYLYPRAIFLPPIQKQKFKEIYELSAWLFKKSACVYFSLISYCIYCFSLFALQDIKILHFFTKIRSYSTYSFENYFFQFTCTIFISENVCHLILELNILLMDLNANTPLRLICTNHSQSKPLHCT